MSLLRASSKFLISLLLMAILSACAVSLPKDAPLLLPPVGNESASDAPAEDAALVAGIAAVAATPTVAPVEAETPANADAPGASPETQEPDPFATATPLPSAITPERARDLALDFVRGSYQLKLPDNATFAPITLDQLPTEIVNVVATYGSGPWQVLVGDAETDGQRVYRTVIVTNPQRKSRWYGQVDNDEVTATLISTYMPRPRSKQVNAWRGKVVKLAPGGPFDDYFETVQGVRHGITSNVPNVNSVLERLQDYRGNVQIWGELRYAQPDYNGRSILVRRIDLLGGPLPTPTEPSSPATTEPISGTVPAENATNVGPTGALTSPEPGVALTDSVLVSGTAQGVLDNSVTIRVEYESGEVLGEATATVDAADVGQPGAFSAQVSFQNPASPGTGRVALYSEDPTLGSLALLTWVNVRFPAAGREKSATITTPTAESAIQSPVTVQGTASGLLMNRVLVRLEDASGVPLAKQRVSVDATGNWSIALSYSAPRTEQRARIAVYDINPATNRTTLIATTPVVLSPR